MMKKTKSRRRFKIINQLMDQLEDQSRAQLKVQLRALSEETTMVNKKN